MAEQSSAYKWVWQKINALTSTRPLSVSDQARYQRERAVDRYRKMKSNIDTLKEFLGDAKDIVERMEEASVNTGAARMFIVKLSGPITIIAHAAGAVDDAVRAAEEVSLQLATWYRHAEAEARNSSDGDDDQYWVLSAAITRLWQARNVKAVLGKQSDSFVSKLWPKWRDRIFSLVF